MHPAAQKGIDLFDQREFYQAHEPLELAWMETDSPERELYQGILQIGLAYYQISRNNYRGTLKMFTRAQRNLEPLGPSFFGIDLIKLREDARIVEAAVRKLGPEQLPHLDQSLINKIPWI